jgi:hypothetical protein
LGAVTKELNELRAKLDEVNNQPQEANQMEMQRITRRMDELLYREEMIWLQRSRISWLQEGDHNTIFFSHEGV